VFVLGTVAAACGWVFVAIAPSTTAAARRGLPAHPRLSDPLMTRVEDAAHTGAWDWSREDARGNALGSVDHLMPAERMHEVIRGSAQTAPHLSQNFS